MTDSEQSIVCVAGYIEVAPEAVEALHAGARAMMAETHKEEGCLVYQMTQDLNDPGRLRIYEEWETKEQLGVHAASDHMKTWMSIVEEIGLEARSLRLFTGTDFRYI